MGSTRMRQRRRRGSSTRRRGSTTCSREAMLCRDAPFEVTSVHACVPFRVCVCVHVCVDAERSLILWAWLPRTYSGQGRQRQACLDCMLMRCCAVSLLLEDTYHILNRVVKERCALIAWRCESVQSVTNI